MLICNKVSTRQCSHFFTTEKRHRQETYYKHVQHIISHTGRRGRPYNGLGPRRKTHDLGGAENYDSGWCMQQCKGHNIFPSRLTQRNVTDRERKVTKTLRRDYDGRVKIVDNSVTLWCRIIFMMMSGL